MSGAIAARAVPAHGSARLALAELLGRGPDHPGRGIRLSDPGREPGPRRGT